VPVRVLILTASVGEGHDLPARTLAAQIRHERPDVDVVIQDGLAPMGRLVTAISADAGRIVFFRLQWLWDLGFWLFVRFGPTRRATQRLLTLVGGRGILRLIAEVNPDVIVCTYPNTTEVLGRLRLAQRLRVPVCAAITDLAAMHYWATPGADVHLVTQPESIAEVRAVAGANARVHCVHGLTSPEFLVRRPAEEARRALGLPAEGKIVLVSGGGWGVGDLAGAAEAALSLASISLVVCLCGRNERLRTQLRRRFGAGGRVRVEGFTDRMRDWLAAADVLVHSTGGLTVLEALMQGCTPISYGWGRGHIRANNAAFRRFGLADVVDGRDELTPAIVRALARPRPSPPAIAGLPSAASIVLAEVG
jgi:processive 1,2-diacylglycerol beta-glucosyltransferase